MLLLLDIDGVMVQASSWKPVEVLNDGFAGFDARAVSGIQQIIAETGATIVLTTSHKYKYTLPQWKEIFKNRGIEAVIDRLEDNRSFLTRKEEIVRWAETHPIEDYVIIDDDTSLNGLPPKIKNRLVMTNSMLGLTEELARNAIQILNTALIS